MRIGSRRAIDRLASISTAAIASAADTPNRFASPPQSTPPAATAPCVVRRWNAAVRPRIHCGTDVDIAAKISTMLLTQTEPPRKSMTISSQALSTNAALASTTANSSVARPR